MADFTVPVAIRQAFQRRIQAENVVASVASITKQNLIAFLLLFTCVAKLAL